MPPPASRPGRRHDILDAAFRCFARHGFRRTSMGEIAREAAISRAALYLHFETKEALFRALVERLHEQALAAAGTAARAELPVARRFLGVLEAKSLRLFEVLRSSEHAQEFIDKNNRLCGDVSGAAARRYERLITDMLARADADGELALNRAGIRPAAAAEMLLAMVDGLKARGGESLTAAQYRTRLSHAVRVLLTGLGAKARSRHRPGRSALV
jgi:AcrR family transcriptional regulator